MQYRRLWLLVRSTFIAAALTVHRLFHLPTVAWQIKIMNEPNLSIKPPNRIYGLRQITARDFVLSPTKPALLIKYEGRLISNIDHKINWIHPFERVT